MTNAFLHNVRVGIKFAFLMYTLVLIAWRKDVIYALYLQHGVNVMYALVLTA